MSDMNIHYIPQPKKIPQILVSFEDLRTAWMMLASPDKTEFVEETLETLLTTLHTQSSVKTVYTMVAATAWLTDRGEGSGND